MANPIARGDLVARMTSDVKDALEVGGIACGFTLTTPDYGEFDAFTADGTKLEIRVEVKS